MAETATVSEQARERWRTAGRLADVLESAEPEALEERLRRLNLLLDQVVAGTSLTRLDLLSALRDRYREYKRAQLLAEARRRSV